jgi:hypothetical protein
MRAILALIACLALASCVSAPKGPPTVSDAELRGHALDPTDTVVVHVSNLWSSTGQAVPLESSSKTRRTVEPAKDLEVLRKAFVTGFNSVKPGSRLVFADQQLEGACFAVARRAEREPWTEPVQPNWEAPSCLAALQASRARYLVSVQGWLSTESGTGVESLGFGAAVTETTRYHFEAVAAVFDAASGLRICGDRGWQDPNPTSRGAGLVIAPFPIPVPIPLAIYETVDAKAYWEHAAWQAGARIGSCFVAPTEPAITASAEAVDTGSTESRHCGGELFETGDLTPGASDNQGTPWWCLVDPQACPMRCNFVDYESCAPAKPDQRFRCVLWGPSKPARPGDSQ